MPNLQGTMPGALTRVYVTVGNVALNKAQGYDRPVFCVDKRPHGGETHDARSVEIFGPSRLVYDSRKPFGYSAWLETEAEVSWTQ